MPDASLAAAAGGLGVGDDDRAVTRASFRKGGGTVIGGR
jgi:hypothetical protein